jgi:starch synthase (maltosyl-transferring)
MLLLPSHYEGMPNVVLEAMAAGRAVVCSRVHGSEELLSVVDSDSSVDASAEVDRRTPQSFAAGDGDAMARRAIALFDDREFADRLGQVNREHVERHFSYPEMVSKYETLYASLIRDG